MWSWQVSLRLGNGLVVRLPENWFGLYIFRYSELNLNQYSVGLFAVSDGLKDRVHSSWRVYLVSGGRKICAATACFECAGCFLNCFRALKAACTFSGSPRGARVAIDHTASGLEVLCGLRLAVSGGLKVCAGYGLL